MKNVVCISLAALLSLCLVGCDGLGWGTPAVQPTQYVAVTPPPAPTPEPTSDQENAEASTLRISATLEEGYTLVAEREDFLMEPVYAYLYADGPVYDILVGDLYRYTGEGDPQMLETGLTLYVPELAPGQAVKLQSPYPLYEEGALLSQTRIAYTDSHGAFQAALVEGDREEENPSLVTTDISLPDKKYDEQFATFETFMPADFYEKVTEGAFDAYVPSGMSILMGSLGDVNADGNQDALLCLTSAAPSLASAEGIMPLFVLAGQPGGGYVLHERNTQAMFTPYRSCSYAVAGEGYIDLIYEYTGGAGCHHTQANRFWYDAAQDDWFLKEFSYQSSYARDYITIIPPVFVAALPDFAGKPLKDFTSGEFYNSEADWEAFDAVATLAVKDWSEYHYVYTLGVKLNKEEEYYEGYIHLYYESIEAGGFIQTIRGAYEEGSELVIAVDEEDASFTVQGDTWKLNENDADEFYLK